MKKQILAVALGCAAISALPAMVPEASAQTRTEQRRWNTAERRFENERNLYERERQRYEEARSRSGRRGPGGPGGYNRGPSGYDDRYVVQYDASRYYRDDPRYTERRLSSNDEVYRGSDGRYYCKRNDGTTGLIIGAAGGALLGNVIDGGSNRVGGTLIGGALGALLGQSIEKNSAEVRCR
jgi:hypothetical protein